MKWFKVAMGLGVLFCGFCFQGCVHHKAVKMAPVKPIVIDDKVSVDHFNDSQDFINQVKRVLRDRHKQFENIGIPLQDIYFNRFVELRSILNYHNAYVTKINVNRNFVDPDSGLFDVKKYKNFIALLSDQKKSLTALILSGNDMDDPSVSYISTLISSQANGLEELDLRYNLISNKGLISLIESLKDKNSRITTLLVDGNSFDAAARSWAISTVELINRSQNKSICLDLAADCKLS